MVFVGMDPKLTEQQIERFRQVCNDAGMKLTHQRLEIFKELLEAKDHPSAERVHKRLQVRMPSLAIDTVYRTLSTFNELGLIKKLHISNDRTLFDPNTEQHHHFVCSRCKKVDDIYWPDFDQTALPAGLSGIGSIQSRHLELHGVCSECMEKEE